MSHTQSTRRGWKDIPPKVRKAIVTVVVAIIFAAGVLIVSWLTPGCTRGQLTPVEIKNPTYGARADAIITANEIRAVVVSDTAPAEEQAAIYKALTEKALGALDRIGGTPGKAYDDGLLAPIYHYLTGTKPTEATP